MTDTISINPAQAKKHNFWVDQPHWPGSTTAVYVIKADKCSNVKKSGRNERT